MSIHTQPMSSGNTGFSAKEMLEENVQMWYEFDDLRRQIRKAERAPDPIEAFSFLLGEYIVYGNHKIADSVAIFNMNSAHDCDNRQSERCQVGDGECYAVQSEKQYPNSLAYRKRQEVLWDAMDPVTWAKAFRRHLDRKRKDVVAIRFSQSGDFRHRQDILKVNEIARRLEDLVDVYTYSASSDLDWSEATHFTVNRSNDLREYGDRRFGAVPTPEQIPDDAVHCPFDASDGGIKCGDCRLCIDADADDVYVTIH